MKTVIIGIAPARPGEEGQPLSALAPRSTGRKIASMLEMKPMEYMAAFDRVNVCPTAQTSTIDPKKYVHYAENLTGSLLRERRVILLGQNVAACFGIEDFEYLVWKSVNLPKYGLVGWRANRIPPFEWAVLPHPSGRNRWYNDRINVMRASEFLQTEKRRMTSGP